MLLRRFVLRPHWFLAGLLVAQGCATYTDLPDPGPSDQAAAKEMPQLAAALDTVIVTREGFQSRRNQLDITHQIFSQGVFLLAGAAAGALIFDAPRLVALALGTGAGAAYSYGALFHPSSRAALYNAGVQALSCVYDKGAPTLAAFSTVEAQKTIAGPAVGNCGETNACKAAIAEYTTATDGAQALFEADGAAAEPVRQATQNVIIEVNKQAEAAIPDLGRVFQVAAGIGNVPAAFVPAKKVEAPATGRESVAIQNDQALETLKNSTVAINSAVSLARTKLDSLSTPCPVEVATDAPLTIDASNQKITFTAPGTYEFSIKGGTQPLTANWNGAGPDKDVLDYIYLPPRTIRLVAKKVDGGPYNLLVSDSKAAVNVEVSMTKPSS